MTRFKMTIEYDGTPYVGFQIQPNGVSVQETLQKALFKMTKGQTIYVHGSGRTDSGVHALGQVVHLDYPSEINEESLLKALNSITPDSIRIVAVEKVEPTFHARYHTIGKRYRYLINTDKFPSPFTSRYQLHHPFPTDVGKMQTALKAVLGTHDFESFCSTKTDKTMFTRTLTQAEVTQDPHTGKITFVFSGDGFLYNMVRILVGTALQIGDGLKPVSEMTRILAAKNRNAAGPTAPAHGLYLEEVFYPSREERDKKVATWLFEQEKQD